MECAMIIDFDYVVGMNKALYGKANENQGG